MDSTRLNAPFTPAVLAGADTATLKTSLLNHVEQRDGDPMGKKVRFAKEILMPLFAELATRNPTPDLYQQIPLLQGVWLTVWSTIPFQDIIPGRVRPESYQIFNDNGYYANLARYKPGRKTPLLKWIARWLLSYDFMIMQTYRVQEQSSSSSKSSPKSSADVVGTTEGVDRQYWNIQNVGIRQSLRFGSRSFSPDAAQKWFDQALFDYQSNQSNQKDQLSTSSSIKNKGQINAKQYEKIAKAKPYLEHLYIDQDFRLVKSQREKSQRPSYTIATRLI